MRPIEVERKTYFNTPHTLVILNFELLHSFASNYLLRQCIPWNDHSLREAVPAWFTSRSFLGELHAVPLRRVSALAKTVSSRILSRPCIILCVSGRSPLFRLSSNVVSLNSFNLCSYGNFLNGVTILVARCWICSSALISLFKYEAHVCMQG